jgi:uncharacterized membrane protein
MSELVVAVCDDPAAAEEIRLDLLRMDIEHLIDLENAVVLIRKKEGEVKLHQVSHLTLKSAATGGFIGTLFGVIY